MSLLISAKSVFQELVAATLSVLVPILNPPDETPPSVYAGLASVAYHFPPISELKSDRYFVPVPVPVPAP